MPIIYQSQIVRPDLKANPRLLYLFGDNEARRGLGGQAAQMRGEPNAIGIRTKRKPAATMDSYWIEGAQDRGAMPAAHYIAMVESDFAPVRLALGRGELVVMPLAGIGTGLSRLEEFAPATFRYLQTVLSYAAKGRFDIPGI